MATGQAKAEILTDLSPALTAEHERPLLLHPQIAGTLCASGAGLNRPAGMKSETDFCILSAGFCYKAGSKAGSIGYREETAPTLIASQPRGILSARAMGFQLRRLMPVEAERLMGFPDFWTEYGQDGKPISDGLPGVFHPKPQDKTLGSMVLSIESSGVKEAVILRQRDDGEYQLLSGYRRRRACELAKKQNIPAHVYEMTMQEAIAYRKAVKQDPHAPIPGKLLDPGAEKDKTKEVEALAAPGEKPEEGKKPPIPGEKPDEGKTPPIPGEKPDEGKNPPAPGEKPDEGKKPPVPGEKPGEGEKPPTPGENPPTVAELEAGVKAGERIWAT